MLETPSRAECEAEAREAEFERTLRDDLLMDPKTAWKVRCMDAALSAVIKDPRNRKALRRHKYWTKWWDLLWDDAWTAYLDACDEASDPYAYYGVRRSDF